MRSRGALLLATVLTLVCGVTSDAGLMETNSLDGRIRINPTPSTPQPFINGLHDFALMLWVRRTNSLDGAYWSVLDLGEVLTIGFDDADDGVLVQLDGDAEDLELLLPLRDGSPQQKLPVDEWMLLAITWDESARTLRGWAQSEAVARVEAIDAAAEAWSGPSPWPPTIGARGDYDSFAGQIGMVVIRDHIVDGTDFDMIWNGESPHYCDPLRLDAGNMNDVDGVAWATGHGIATGTGDALNPEAEGAELGDLVTPNNLLVYNHNDPSGWIDAGRIDAVDGEWILRSPHEPGEPWSGFFARQIADIGLADPPYVEQFAPRSRRLALDEPDGLIRVAAVANSRAIRIRNNHYDQGFENWALGGVYRTRKHHVAGSLIPAAPLWSNWPAWPGFKGLGATIGPVSCSEWTQANHVAFGNFGSYRAFSSDHIVGYPIYGNAIVISDEASFIPRARPEAGTLFDDKTDPLTVRVMLLRFPGSGDAIYQGSKASSPTSVGEYVGEPTTVPMDTTTVVHSMGTTDAWNLQTLQLTLQDPLDEIAVGDGCFISDGPGEGGISVVTDVQVDGETTIVTLEKKYKTSPVPGESTLRFGPIEPIWVEHAWQGLDPDDPLYYRGISVSASGGRVVLLFMECYNPDADGFIVAPIGASGLGYRSQFQRLFSDVSVPAMQALGIDVWLLFFANQGSNMSDQINYTALIQSNAPDSEIWWCGDPDYDLFTEDYQGTDSWQHFIIEHAAEYGVGGIIAHDHPFVGTGNERLVDGQTANTYHLSARGNTKFLEAVFDLMQSAALNAPPSCLQDINSDGVVGVSDLLIMLTYWGACTGPCAPDLNDDDVVDVLDLLALLGAWGPCDG